MITQAVREALAAGRLAAPQRTCTVRPESAYEMRLPASSLNGGVVADWPALRNQINIAANKVQRILDEMRWEDLTEAETAARLRLAETMIHDWIEQIETAPPRLTADWGGTWDVRMREQRRQAQQP